MPDQQLMANCLEDIFSVGLIGLTNQVIDNKVKEITMNYEKFEMELIAADSSG